MTHASKVLDAATSSQRRWVGHAIPGRRRRGRGQSHGDGHQRFGIRGLCAEPGAGTGTGVLPGDGDPPRARCPVEWGEYGRGAHGDRHARTLRSKAD